MPDDAWWNARILFLSMIVFVGLEMYSVTTHSHYKYDFIFIVLVCGGVYLYRDTLNLHPAHFGLYCLMLIIHNLGTFRLYETSPLGLEYDHWVHIFAGFVMSLIIYRAVRKQVTWKNSSVYALVMVAVLGIAAFHELFEFGGALVVGKGEGVLFIGAGDLDEWDTQKDMLNDAFGGLIGIFILEAWRRNRTSSTSSPSPHSHTSRQNIALKKK